MSWQNLEFMWSKIYFTIGPRKLVLPTATVGPSVIINNYKTIQNIIKLCNNMLQLYIYIGIILFFLYSNILFYIGEISKH